MSNIEKTFFHKNLYEKFMYYGESSLTNSELLSIIIRNGTKDESALEIAQNLINLNSNDFNNLRFLQELSIQELQRFKGIGNAKALELKAVGEISKRIFKPLNFKIKIKNELDIINLFMCEMQNEKNEVLKILMLNNKNIIVKLSTIAVGNENNISSNIKLILSEPVKIQVPKIILIHNHPSGDSTPSREDIVFTNKVKKAAEILDIQLLTHIIIGDGNYNVI